MARPSSREKSELSKAVCGLRTALGDSQQAFSNRLGVALNSVARWETVREPSGEWLKKLGLLAEQNGQQHWRDFFFVEYLAEIQRELGKANLTVVHETESQHHGYLFAKLDDQDQVDAASYFLLLLGGLRTKASKKYRKAAMDTLNALSLLVTELLEQQVDCSSSELGFGYAYPQFLTPPASAPTTTTTKSKRKKKQ